MTTVLTSFQVTKRGRGGSPDIARAQHCRVRRRSICVAPRRKLRGRQRRSERTSMLHVVGPPGGPHASGPFSGGCTARS